MVSARAPATPTNRIVLNVCTHQGGLRLLHHVAHATEPYRLDGYAQCSLRNDLTVLLRVDKPAPDFQNGSGETAHGSLLGPTTRWRTDLTAQTLRPRLLAQLAPSDIPLSPRVAGQVPEQPAGRGRAQPDHPSQPAPGPRHVQPRLTKHIPPSRTINVRRPVASYA